VCSDSNARHASFLLDAAIESQCIVKRQKSSRKTTISRFFRHGRGTRVLPRGRTNE